MSQEDSQDNKEHTENSEHTEFYTDRLIQISDDYSLQWDQTKGYNMLVYADGVVKLNKSANKILVRCNGENTATDIVKELQDIFPEVELAEDVHAFLQESLQNGWIYFKAPSDSI